MPRSSSPRLALGAVALLVLLPFPDHLFAQSASTVAGNGYGLRPFLDFSPPDDGIDNNGNVQAGSPFTLAIPLDVHGITTQPQDHPAGTLTLDIGQATPGAPLFINYPFGSPNCSETTDQGNTVVTCTWDAFNGVPFIAVFGINLVAPVSNQELTVSASVDPFAATFPDDEPSQSVTLTVVGEEVKQADLEVTATLPGTPPKVGQEFEIDVTVRNNGPELSLDTGVRITVDDAIQLLSGAPSRGGCDVIDQQHLFCALGPLGEGGEATITVRARGHEAGTFGVTTEVEGNLPDDVPANNVDEDLLVVEEATEEADLSIGLVAEGASLPDGLFTLGEDVGYVLTLRNDGPDPATNVRVILDLPKKDPEDVADPLAVDLLEVDPDKGMCSTALNVICTIDTVAPGETVFVFVEATPRVTGFLQSSAFVTSDVPDPDPADNADAVTIQVIAPVALAVEPDADIRQVGEEGKATVTVTNESAQERSVRWYYEAPPEGVTLLGGEADTGDATLDEQANRVEGEATLPPGERLTARIRWTVDRPGTWEVTAGDEDGQEATGTVEGTPETKSTENNTESGDTADPINTFTGELFFTESPDLALGGPLPVAFTRSYGSFLARDGRVQSALGPNWAHAFDARLIRLGERFVEVVTARGRAVGFARNGGTWRQGTMTHRPYQLVEDGEGFVFADPRVQRLYTFDAAGRLSAVADGQGNALTLTYAGGRLTTVADGLGRLLVFTYAGDRLATVSDGTRTVRFAYDADGTLASATNAAGETVTYSYDAGPVPGLLLARTQPEGYARYTQTYDAAGRVTAQADALGNTTRLQYDAGETTVIDALGNSLKHLHDAEGRLTAYTDKAGRMIAHAYDDLGFRIETTDRLGDAIQTTYDAVTALPTARTEANGGTTRYTYGPRAVAAGVTFYDLTGVTYPDGTTSTRTYDADGNPITVTDPAGGLWRYSYNDRGQPLSATNPEGGTTTFTYDADAALTAVTDPAGNTTAYGYDTLRRLATVTNADGTTRRFTYDDADRLITRTDEAGRVTAFAYDANGNLTTLTDPAGETIRYAYDAMDRVVAVTDRLGETTRAAYDALGRLATLTAPDGRTVLYGYDADGRLTTLADFGGQTWTVAYDAEGVPTAFTTPNGETTTYTSNAMGWITQVTSPGGHTSEIGYDVMGRVTTVTDALGQTTTYWREARGLLEAMTLPDGATAGYTRDGLGLLETLTDPNDERWPYPRDAQGRLTAETDPLGRTTAFTHDSRNRVVETTLPGGLGTAVHGYDATDRPTDLTFADGTRFGYGYDATGRLVEVTTSAGPDGTVALERDAEGRLTDASGFAVARDARGRPTHITLPGGDVAYHYDARGLVTAVEDWLGGQTTFTYDAAGRLTQLTRPNGTTTAYTYDADGRLLGIEDRRDDGSLIAAATLARDARGDVVRAERTAPVAPTLTPGVDEYTYDAASQVDAFNYDDLGRLTEDGTRTYTWNHASQLVAYTEGGETVELAYDALGHRIARTAGGVTRTYRWNYALGLPAVAVEQDDGVDRRTYVHTPSGQLLYSVDAADGSRRFYHYDETGNTVLLTDEAGAVVAAYAYSPFGEVLAEAGDEDNPFTWQGIHGVMREGTTGLYYVRARTYDSRTGRFLSRDPVRSTHPATITPYQYGSNNPKRFVDPTGLDVIAVSEPVGYSDLFGYSYRRPPVQDPTLEELFGGGVGGTLFASTPAEDAVLIPRDGELVVFCFFTGRWLESCHPGDFSQGSRLTELFKESLRSPLTSSLFLDVEAIGHKTSRPSGIAYDDRIPGDEGADGGEGYWLPPPYSVPHIDPPPLPLNTRETSRKPSKSILDELEVMNPIN